MHDLGAADMRHFFSSSPWNSIRFSTLAKRISQNFTKSVFSPLVTGDEVTSNSREKRSFKIVGKLKCLFPKNFPLPTIPVEQYKMPFKVKEFRSGKFFVNSTLKSRRAWMAYQQYSLKNCLLYLVLYFGVFSGFL